MGSVRVLIVREAIEVDRNLGSKDGERGAVVEFQGVVRGMEDGAPIRGLDYECHLEMAEIQLRRIAEDVSRFFDLEMLVVIHRIGFVQVGETSLYLRAESVHRRAAIQAVEEAIVRLKRDVPIWKSVIPGGDSPR